MARIIVDTREPEALFKALDSADVTFERATLDVADFHVFRDDRLLFTVERKTWSDLEASCVDGRMLDQLVRAAANAKLQNAQHVVLLEHSTVPRDAQLRCSVAGKDNRGLRARSAIDRLVLQHGVGVVRTADVTETARLLKWIATKSVRELWAPEGGQVCGTYYGGSVQVKKSANQDDARGAWLCMLQVVRGVSDAAARAIADAYPNAAAIVDAKGAAGGVDVCVERLACVRVNNKRKLGPQVARRVVRCLCGE